MITRGRMLWAAFLTGLCVWGAQPPLYKIDTLAGTAWTGEGQPASRAVFVQPQCVALDAAGSIYISDTGEHRVRRISVEGSVRTIAGTGTPGINGDGGPGPMAQLNAPYGIAVDTFGNVFIADLGNAVVRRISASDGSIRIWAGGGKDPVPTVGTAAARTVALIQPRDVAIDRSGNLIIADFGAHRIYSVSPGGAINVIAGNGEIGSITKQTPALLAPLAYPSAIAIDINGFIVIADSGNRRVRRLGAGYVWTVTDKNSREIEFGTPTGIATDSAGRIYVADGSSTRIAVISTTSELTSVPIGGTSVAVAPYFDVFTVSERRVRRLSGGTRVDIVAGQGAGDGRTRTEWRFSAPSSAVRDSGGAVWIADTGLGRIRKLTTGGELSTGTTALDTPISMAIDSAGRVWAGERAGGGGVFRVDNGAPRPLVQGQNRPLVPTAMAFDASDYLYIADSANHLIRRVAPDGSMVVIAGGGRETGDGQGLQLKLLGPAGIAVDAAGTIWFSEAATGKLRRIVGGRVITVTGIELVEPRGLKFDREGSLWIADAGAHRVIVLEPSGTWYPVAGSGDRGLSGDGGLALAAALNAPSDIFLDRDGSALIVDTGNDRIRRIEKQGNEPEPPVTPPVTPPVAGGITLSPVNVLHVATLLESDLAPGQLAYVTGKSFSSPEVLFDGQPLPLLETSPTRLTIQIPSTARPGFAELVVRNDGQLYGRVALKITGTNPGILTAANGKGPALAINADGQRNGPENPAERGSVVSLFVTGDAGASPGEIADIAGYAADVVWFGPAPTLIGVTQVNVQTPGGFSPSGAVSVALAFDGVRTQPGVLIYSR